MEIAELIALAKIRSGKSQKEMAADMGYTHAAQVSKIASGIKAPDASEIIYFATAAKMEPFKVLAEMESQRHPALATMWKSITNHMVSLYLTTLKCTQRAHAKFAIKRTPNRHVRNSPNL